MRGLAVFDRRYVLLAAVQIAGPFDLRFIEPGRFLVEYQSADRIRSASKRTLPCGPTFATAAGNSVGIEINCCPWRCSWNGDWLGMPDSRSFLGAIGHGYLYLRNPADGRLYGFQFNVDFFACAAHERWWHDHRAPGGIAFTANSLGHMRAFREWYDTKQGDASEWAVRLAMVTIDNADTGKVPAKSPEQPAIADGGATWLRPLVDGKPFIADLASPLTKTPATLQGKDWTKYDGYLHTDHAVRAEFFRDRAVPPTIDKPYIMDFTYIYDQNQADFIEFTQGRPITDDEVYAEIGRPEEWTNRTAAVTPARSETEATLVAQQLAACEQWSVNPRYLQVDD